MTRLILSTFMALGACAAVGADSAVPPKETVDCYVPVEGGWQIHITGDPASPRLKPGSAIGVVVDDPRQHRRPLYPPSDRSFVWTKEELAQRQRIPCRPMVLAANEPRFVMNLDAGGGLSGHLLLGVSLDHGPSKWLHQFGDLDVRYVDGRMEYVLRDAAFPGLRVQLSALPLADSVGLVIKIRVEGPSQPGELVWVFGGASGFTTNYNHDDPQYRFSPEQCADNVIRWEDGRLTLLRKGVAVMRGGTSWNGGIGFGDPEKIMTSPAALSASAQWCAAAKTAEKPRRVAMQRIRLDRQPVDGWLVIGRGGKIESFLADPREAERLAWREIARSWSGSRSARRTLT